MVIQQSRMILRNTLIFAFFFIFLQLFGQLKEDSLLIGNWGGTSICQQKNSPCHDEQAAYHISKDKSDNKFRMVMNKVVNGVEEEMGVLMYEYDYARKELTCSSNPDTIWKFKLEGKKMDGTLYYKGVLYRIIKLKKLE